MRGSREEKRISENFEQVQKELRTSSKLVENRFIFLEGEIPHMESRRHGVCEEIVLDITQG